MTIGFDASRAFYENKTGTENYSYQLLKHLAKIDQKNSYLIYIRPDCNVSESWPENFKFKKISYKFLWTQLGLSLQTFRDHLDLLFVPAHTVPLIRKPGLKTVMTIHDLGVEYLPSLHQLKQSLYLKWITKYQIKSATKLIAVSNSTKNDLIKKARINPKKINVIYEGYDEELFKAPKIDQLKEVLNKFELERDNYFFFVGTIQPRKNLTRLIKAYFQFRSSMINLKQDPLSIKLVLAGGKGWQSDDIYKLPQKLGIDSQVKFLGRVEDTDLPALYSGAKALVFPSLFEGFGLPILEAMACGCPVIAANSSSLPEVVEDAGLLVNPLDIDNIANSMRQIVIDNDLRDSLIKKGFQQLKNFSWQKAATQTLEVFEECANTE